MNKGEKIRYCFLTYRTILNNAGRIIRGKIIYFNILTKNSEKMCMYLSKMIQGERLKAIKILKYKHFLCFILTLHMIHIVTRAFPTFCHQRSNNEHCRPTYSKRINSLRY